MSSESVPPPGKVSRRSLALSGIVAGLVVVFVVVNGVWTKPPTEPNATPLPDNKPDGWNTDPGNQYIPKGRRPIGPFGYSTATSLREPKEPIGTGTFYARLPTGRKTMITTVRNNGTADGTLRVEINGSAAGEPAPVKLLLIALIVGV